MKILFAAPDRDLLECYKKLLEKDFGEIVTAFDGAQVLSLLSSESFDIAVIDEAIPRIEAKTLIARIMFKKLPVIVLTNEPLSVNRFTGEQAGTEYLAYPFDAQDLAEIIRRINKAEKGFEVDSNE